MLGKEKKRGLIGPCLAVILALFIAIPIAMGEEKKTESQNTIAPTSPRVITYRNFGTVYRVAEDEIVVDDQLMKFAPDVVYHGPDSGGGLTSKNIKEGTRIGFNLNEKKEVTDIWILKKK